MRMSNRWNRFIYRLWAPVYDALLERLFYRGRERAMEVAAPTGGERICLIGVGTGTDLLNLPRGTTALGIDLSEPMIDRARAKLPISGVAVMLRVGDAQALPINETEELFDVVFLSLILSVVPEPRRSLAEALRVLRPGGRVVIFDKFLPDGQEPSQLRSAANICTSVFGTNINRRLGDITEGVRCRVVLDEPSILRGMYRIILMEKLEE